MARKKKEEERENHERWLVSYADFITLLFAFFVVMYSISEVNAKKFRKVGVAFQNAFNFIGLASPGKPALFRDKLEQPIQLPLGQQPSGRGAGEGGYDALLAQIQAEIEATLKDDMAIRKIRDLTRVHMEERGLVISLAANEFFRPGEATLVPSLLPTIDKLAAVLNQVKLPIRIEGDTDNTPIHTALYASNWELSAARALNVVHYLIDHDGFDPHRLSATAYGQFRPLVSNATETGRNMNRRVDIVILNIRKDRVEPTPYGYDPTASAVLDRETGRGPVKPAAP